MIKKIIVRILKEVLRVISIVLIIPVIGIVGFFVAFYTSVIFPVMLLGWIISKVRGSDNKPYKESKGGMRLYKPVVQLGKEPSVLMQILKLWAEGLKSVFS